MATDVHLRSARVHEPAYRAQEAMYALARLAVRYRPSRRLPAARS